MLSLETEQALQQVSSRIKNAAEVSYDLCNRIAVVSEVSSSIDVVASRIFEREKINDSQVITGGRSIPLTLALFNLCLSRVGLRDTSVITLDGSENKKMYEGENYNPSMKVDRSPYSSNDRNP